MEKAIELVHSRHVASIEFGAHAVTCDAAHSIAIPGKCLVLHYLMQQNMKMECVHSVLRSVCLRGILSMFTHT